MDDFDLDDMVDRCLGVASGAASVSSNPPHAGDGGHGVSRQSRQRGGVEAFSPIAPTPKQQRNVRGNASSPRGDTAAGNFKPSLLYSSTTPMQHANFHVSGHGGEYAAAENFNGVQSAAEGPLEIQSGGGLTGRSYDSPSTSGRQDPTLRRIQLWAERREAKRAILVYERLQEELRQCTFHPARETTDSDLSSQLSPSALYKDNRAWGFDEFVDRLVGAREQKKLKEEEDERRKSGVTGSNWHPGATVPEPFEFNRFNRRPIPSLKGHYEELAPVLRDGYENTMSTIEAPSVPPGLFSVRPSNVIMEHATPERR